MTLRTTAAGSVAFDRGMAREPDQEGPAVHFFLNLRLRRADLTTNGAGAWPQGTQEDEKQ